MPQGQGRASVDVAPVTRTESRAAAIELWTQSSLERRKSTSGALDLEGLRSNEQLQLQYCTDHMDGGTESTTALDEAASEPEHRTGTSTTGYRHSDMHSIIADMRKNHVLSAYSPPLLSAAVHLLLSFCLDLPVLVHPTSAAAHVLNMKRSLNNKAYMCHSQLLRCGLRPHASQAGSTEMHLTASSAEPC